MGKACVVRASDITGAVAALYRRINTRLRSDVRAALERAREQEDNALARDLLGALLENERISAAEGLPLCQDTGLAVAFVRMGENVVLRGGTLQSAVDEGIRQAAERGPLRASTVGHPLKRDNVGDNTPAIVHLESVPGDTVQIHLLAKGGGAENMSRVHMLNPGDGREGVIEAVVSTTRLAGANACPPVILGVGLGGNFERAPLLAKRALLRELDEPNADPDLAALEQEILERVNALGIGPQGFGGRTTALAVLIEEAPCHIASLPLAVNVECHSHRHGSVELRGESSDKTGPRP